MAKKITCALALLAIAAAPTLASGSADADRTPTFHRDVLPILQQNCQTCHRPSGLDLGGMVAPMSLMTYDEVRPWARSVAKEVLAGEMPPWDATPEFNGVFKNERVLDQGEIDTIVAWAKAGAPAGDPSDAPQPIEFSHNPGGWTLDEKPDLVLQLPEPVWVADEVEDWQPTFAIEISEEMMPEDRWIKAVEFKPDNTDVVHHIVGYSLAPDGVGGEGSGRGMIGGIAPGSELDVHPEGFGMRLYKGSKILINMHYHKEPGEGTGAYDQSSMAIWFHDQPVRHDVRWEAIGTFSFEIPPHTADWKVGASKIFAQDSLVLALSPHMHFRGKDMKYTAYYPDGETEVLLDVPSYDYNWQHHYVYAEPKFLPAGTRIDVIMTFDNSTDNPANPDPSKVLRFGERSDDEMAFGWIDYTNAEPLPLPAPTATGGR